MASWILHTLDGIFLKTPLASCIPSLALHLCLNTWTWADNGTTSRLKKQRHRSNACFGGPLYFGCTLGCQFWPSPFASVDLPCFFCKAFFLGIAPWSANRHKKLRSTVAILFRLLPRASTELIFAGFWGSRGYQKINFRQCFSTNFGLWSLACGTTSTIFAFTCR